MKKLFLAAMTLCAVATGCQNKEQNPLLADFNAPFNTPPFDKIRPEHYKPAFEQAIAEMKAEVEAIATNAEAPTFENTIVALEQKGRRLTTVAGIFFNLNEAHTSPEMEAVALEVQPLMTQAGNDISLDPRLFGRVKSVYDYYHDTKCVTDPLETDQWMLLEKTYKSFTRSGAALGDEDKARYRAVTEELGNLTLQFGQNVLKATNDFEMVLTEEQVAGLPDFAKEGMAHEAKQKGKEGYLLTLQQPSMSPYMTYATDRAVKEKAWKAYASRGLGGATDNSAIVKRIAELRLQQANLLGYATYADYVLEERMAGDTKTVNGFLSDLLAATKPYAQKDFDMIKAYAASKGQKEFKPWDFAYYEELYKQEKYSLSDEEVKPYLELTKVQEGIFALAGKLYGLTFRENTGIPVFHPEVKVYEVHDGERLMAILYMDYFPRESKRGGAWMTSFREMYADKDGNEVRPLVSLTCNFTKPTDTTPSLLTFYEFTVFLHEFGHCLHGMLAEGRYESLTGTHVYRDFVELPSQILENWATEKEFLDMCAVHYQTGEKMPQELIDKILASKNYLAAYRGVRQLSFGIDDMAWHTITAPVAGSVETFEQNAIRATQFFPYEAGTCSSTSFGHIFGGGYAAGYYGYKWAEVLEADAFSLFKEKGIFDPETAASFRKNILSKGGSENPMELYVRFRGHKPDNAALLRKMGVN